MPGADEPQLLIERVEAGDVAAFEAIYDRFHRLVYAIAFRTLGTHAAAEDVTQAVFLKIWTSPQAFHGGNFAGWIARVARNRAIDVLRGAQREHELPGEIPCDGELDDVLLARIDAERAHAMIAALPADQRNAIELAFFSGLTHQEIARRTAAPLGTVKTRIRAGLQRLRVALAESALA
jgi:RNA polymerase sigma-70 factor (ECF subfamily)